MESIDSKPGSQEIPFFQELSAEVKQVRSAKPVFERVERGAYPPLAPNIATVFNYWALKGLHSG